MIVAKQMKYIGKSTDRYIENDFSSFTLETIEETDSQNIVVYLHTSQTETINEWKNQLFGKKNAAEQDMNARKDTLNWWDSYWERSYVFIGSKEPDINDINWQVGRNYQLFRYMLAMLEGRCVIYQKSIRECVCQFKDIQ